MSCTEFERNETVERHLRGELDEEEAGAFETHLFECEECLEAFKDLSALRTELAEERWAVPDEKRALSPRIWVWVGAAAVLLLTIGLGFWIRSTRPVDATDSLIAELSALEAPAYGPRTLRGGEGQAENLFREAMSRYQEGDYQGAIPGLVAVVEEDPLSVKALFYLGVCYLVTDRARDAVGSFDRVIEARESPYVMRARLYRAKALLRAGDLERAVAALDEVVRLGGESAAEAKEILDRLPR